MMLTKAELRTAILFLRQAAASVQWCSMLFFGSGDSPRAARLNEMLTRLAEEEREIDAMMQAAPDQGGNA